MTMGAELSTTALTEEQKEARAKIRAVELQAARMDSFARWKKSLGGDDGPEIGLTWTPASPAEAEACIRAREMAAERQKDRAGWAKKQDNEERAPRTAQAVAHRDTSEGLQQRGQGTLADAAIEEENKWFEQFVAEMIVAANVVKSEPDTTAVLEGEDEHEADTPRTTTGSET